MFQQNVLKQCNVCHKPIGSLYRAEHIEVDGVRKKIFIHSFHPKKQSEEEVKEKQEDTTKYELFTRRLWKEREHISQLTESKIPDFEPHSKKFLNQIRSCQHHIFAKSLKKFPELKFDDRWILFVTYTEHQWIEFGTTKQKEMINYFQMIEQTQDRVLQEMKEGKLKDKMLAYLENILEDYRSEKLQTA